ncbi:hypothetical protein GCM10009839_48410 [Catenulispora yoronensis]|uniref:Uncharacterized protein n=1 Tax=Catenulispora yoronensis TaxID=450799 RepID=A0ABN2UMY1_9ACTN
MTLVTKTAPGPVAATVAHLLDLLKARGVTVFAVVDQVACHSRY